MITSGYSMELICDCLSCSTNDNPQRVMFIGENYSECAKQARNAGWSLFFEKVAMLSECFLIRPDTF